MKQNIRRLIALVLVLCMVVPLAPTADASVWSLLGWLTGRWDDSKEETPVRNNDEPGMMLALVEDQDTVSEDVEMRAAVYEAHEDDPVAQAELEGSNVVYYPSTFFDYDKDAINQSMANLDVQYAVDNKLSTSSNGWKWKGLYFGEGGSGSTSNRENTTRTGSVGSYKSARVQYSTVRNSTSYYYLAADGNYYQVTCTRSGYSSSSYRYTLTYKDAKGVTQTLVNAASNAYIDLYTYSVTNSVSSKGHESWVKWGLNDTADYGGYIHSKMVTGLVNGVPQFAASYAGRLFDDSVVNGKTRYANVGLPFILDEDGYYTFDSSFNGAYFPDGEAASDVNLTLLDAPVVLQGYRDLGGGYEKLWSTCFMPFNEPVSNNKQNTDIVQTNGDELTTGAYRLQTMSGTSAPAAYNYFFSVVTPVPFTMTENGKMNASDDESDDIIFEFSGDDDVWVFIDDVLVLDLGGIHDAVHGEINFATNEILFENCASGMRVGDATDGGFGANTNNNIGAPISQGAIFNDGDTVGKLNTARSTFAASDNHTLTVVYVERGANLSNNKIRFNLPQKDYVAVTKQIDETLYKQTDETVEDGMITEELFETLNQRNFTYVLYENGVAMKNVRFSRYDASGNFVGNGSTASDGTFNVKNGETVRFYDVNFDGKNSYYVAELDPDAGTNNNAWGTATWAHVISTAYGESATVTDTKKPANYYVSQTVTTQGSEEAVDVIYFTNTNKLLSPVADIADDEFVLDFGLAVELNPLANDTYSATNDRLTLAGISDAADGTFGNSVEGKFGTLEIVDGKVVYTLNKQFTGAETFYYQVGLTSGADDLEGTVGTITIMPATTMYYEENFADLNLTLNYYDKDGQLQEGAWTGVGKAQGGYQEEGRVGTTSDSPYGSDVLYMENSGDSYGTSKYVNTDSNAYVFSYTFTGTGTALYARTSDKSAYMMITVTDKDGNVVKTWDRNTIYKPTADTALTDNTLYNIPVYVFEAEAYGTYTVTVSLTKALKLGASYYRGCDFYLDGIRVYNPANAYTGESADADITLIEDAYAHDGEAYITVDSLRNKLLSDSTKYTLVGEDENGDPVYEIEWDGENFVVFTDSDGTIEDAETYQSAGPKEEVYMKNGQSVTFSLDNWNQNRNKVFLGIKAPSGSGTVFINGNEIKINNTTDIYYDITKYAEVSGGVATFKVKAGSALISVTTIKVTGTADFTIVSGGPAMPEEDIPQDGE